MKAMLAVKADNAIHSSVTTTGTSPADHSSTPKAPEKETKWAVVKGSQTVRIYYTPDLTDKGEIPFFTISYWMHGKRSRHVFPTLKAAKKAAKKKAEELDRGDHGAAKLTNADSAAYCRAIDLLKPSGASLEFAASEYASAIKRLGGVSLSAAVDYYVRRHPEKMESKLVPEVVKEMIDLKRADQLSDRYVNQLSYDMKRFMRRFCNRIGDVRGTEVDAWLRELKVGPRTRNNLRASIQVLFNYAISRKYLEKDNDEMDAVPLAKDKGGEIEIFTPKEMAELLAVASAEQLPFMAISAFAGVRHAEIQRLDWANVNKAAGIIEIRAGGAKTRSRRVIPILPNLAAWLKPHWKEAGPVCSFANMVDQFKDMTRKVNLARRAAWAAAKGVSDDDLKAADARAAKRRKEDNENQKGRRARGSVLPLGSDTAEDEGWAPFAWKQNALRHSFIRQNFLVLYRSIFDLVRDFMKDEAFNQQDKTLRRYLKPDLVIIDDMGLKQLPKHSGVYLLEVIMRRYENKSTIMTSNRPLEEWGKLLCDVPTAGAIIDRFLHHAQVVAITGKSYRVKEAPVVTQENKKSRKSNEPATAEPAS